jgi:hypothetical protein
MTDTADTTNVAAASARHNNPLQQVVLLWIFIVIGMYTYECLCMRVGGAENNCQFGGSYLYWSMS